MEFAGDDPTRLRFAGVTDERVDSSNGQYDSRACAQTRKRV